MGKCEKTFFAHDTHTNMQKKVHGKATNSLNHFDVQQGDKNWIEEKD